MNRVSPAEETLRYGKRHHRALDLRLFAHHSYLSETAGFMLAARRAGKYPASMPIVPSTTEVLRAMAGENVGRPRNSNASPLRGRTAITAMRPRETAVPSTPPITVIIK